MRPFTTLTAVAAPLPVANVDTDQILPGRFLKTTLRTGLGKHLFQGWRYRDDGSENADFVLNRPPFRDARILVTHENFGCGSSREHAPWALLDFGIRCVIAPSFGDIFRNNSFKNGILPITLERPDCDSLMADADLGRNARITVDLDAQQIRRPDGEAIPFSIEPFRKRLLLEGLDDIGQTQQHMSAITSFETKRSETMRWLPR